ncbi:2-oxo-4-hydroxy-4-carboxy-5-ureidoimidazoline decarboxylase [Peribacillus sp. SCS-155]|uniref:2-oxo-4-hydroxy-4-carboxy-5-ureidoimidazoline decarboxylase n=1 Tax=Peribacillus sedimenti TaxID=3115297 RepID=UPI003906988D
MDLRNSVESGTTLTPSPLITLRLEVNGKKHQVTVSPTARLVDILRDGLGLTGTKISCEIGRCGACAVQMDDKLVHSCLVMAYQARDKSICTIEGLAEGLGEELAEGSANEGLHFIQEAFLQEGGFQCGYCTPGMTMAVKALLDVHPDPATEQIQEALSGNLCRCTGYAGIIRSIRRAVNHINASEDMRNEASFIQDINRMDHYEFAHKIGWVYEHSPWIAKKAWESSPFYDREELMQTMSAVVQNADASLKLSLLRAHPDLGTRLKITDASQKEQKGAGLDQLSNDELTKFQSLNKQYVDTFDFPFIMAVKGQNKTTILEALQLRLNNTYEQEFSTALKEVDKIAGFRLDGLFQGRG